MTNCTEIAFSWNKKGLKRSVRAKAATGEWASTRNHRGFLERVLDFWSTRFFVTAWMQRSLISWHPCSQLTCLCMVRKTLLELSIDNFDCTSWWGFVTTKFLQCALWKTSMQGTNLDCNQFENSGNKSIYSQSICKGWKSFLMNHVESLLINPNFGGYAYIA